MKQTAVEWLQEEIEKRYGLTVECRTSKGLRSANLSSYTDLQADCNALNLQRNPYWCYTLLATGVYSNF